MGYGIVPDMEDSDGSYLFISLEYRNNKQMASCLICNINLLGMGRKKQDAQLIGFYNL